VAVCKDSDVVQFWSLGIIVFANRQITGSSKNSMAGRSCAFTLMELLVVIASIGILAALLLAAIAQAKARAKNIQCIGNLHQLGIGLQNFLANNHGYPIFLAKGHTNSDYPGSWMGQLERGGLGVSQPATNYFETGVWRCPSAQWQRRIKFPPFPPGFKPASYGYNAFGIDNIWLAPKVGSRLNAFGLLGHYDPNSGTYAPIGESEVIAPSEMMAMGDGFDTSFLLQREDLVGLESYGNTLTRHQGRANVTFCDGHVESPTLKFLFEDTSDAALVRWNRDHQPHRERL
jgi:prepilin-type processing-associated H-X9-DG protein